jgi:hypothetical protein
MILIVPLLKESISQCYQAIAKYINQAKNISESQELKHVIQLRETLQNARQAWTLDRKLRLGNTRLGESAIILIQDADNLGGVLFRRVFHSGGCFI